MAGESNKDGKKQTTGYKDRPWIPRFWDGMVASVWFPALWRNRFQVHPLRWPMLVIVSTIALINSFLALLQSLFFSRKIARTEIKDDPIFIVGHWRSGTTMLHEMLVLDERHTFPSTYECFTPHHFLFSQKWAAPLLRILLPKQRPMDNMAAGWGHPQEDEFGICNMGVPSPYLTILFPNRPPQHLEYLDFQGVPPAALARWKQSFLWFLKCITLRTPRRIVLKSPPHLARIRVLLELFPRARFVHIVRDPFVVFPSTVNLWKRLYEHEGLQVPRFQGLEEQVLETFNRLYAAFDRDRQLLGPEQYCEVRYEDLVDDPIGQMRQLYQTLRLEGFEQLLPALEEYLAGQAGYKTNRYQISPEIRARVVAHWSAFFERYGYETGIRGQGAGVKGQGLEIGDQRAEIRK